jgi:hypothetical protein
MSILNCGRTGIGSPLKRNNGAVIVWEICMQQTRLGKCIIWAAIVLCALVMSGCENKTINEIKANPSQYAGREVTVAAEVVRSYSVLGKGAYEIDDGTGKMWVVSQTGVPRKGAKIVVKGTVRDAYDLSFLGLPEPLGSGLVLSESAHKAR